MWPPVTIVLTCDKCDHMWQVWQVWPHLTSVTMTYLCDQWPHVTSVTTFNKCEHMWQVWTHVTGVNTCGDKCDHMWQVLQHVTSVTTGQVWPHHGYLDIIETWISWTFGHHGHFDIMVVEHHGHSDIMDILDIIKEHLKHYRTQVLQVFPSFAMVFMLLADEHGPQNIPKN